MAPRSSGASIAFSLASRVGVLFLNVATGIVMARTLGPAGRGAVSAIALWPVVLSGVLTLGIPVALRYHVRRKSDDADALLSVALVMSAGLGLAASLAGILLVPLWLKQYSHDVLTFAQIMMVFAPFVSVNVLLQAYLEARGEFARSGSMLYIPPAGTLLALALLHAFHRMTVLNVALAYELPFSCITLYTLYRLRSSIHRPTAFLSRSKVLLHFGVRAYGLDILSTLNGQIGQVVVVGLLSASSFGLYAVALNVSRTLLILGSSLNAVLFPKASELDKGKAVDLVARSARVIFAVNASAAAALIMLMPFLIRLAYGSQYAGDVQLAQVLTCEVVFAATVATLSQAFMATDRPGLVTIFQTIGLCTTFPLMLALVPRFGIMGAAYALLASTLLRFVLVLASYPLFLHHRAPRLILTRDDISSIGARLRLSLGRA